MNYDDYNNSKVTYSDVLLKCTDVCRSVANDQEIYCSVMNGVIEWTNKLRMKHIV